MVGEYLGDYTHPVFLLPLLTDLPPLVDLSCNSCHCSSCLWFFSISFFLLRVWIEILLWDTAVSYLPLIYSLYIWVRIHEFVFRVKIHKIVIRYCAGQIVPALAVTPFSFAPCVVSTKLFFVVVFKLLNISLFSGTTKGSRLILIFSYPSPETNQFS